MSARIGTTDAVALLRDTGCDVRAGARSVWIAAHGPTASCDGPAIPQLGGKGRLQVWAM